MNQLCRFSLKIILLFHCVIDYYGMDGKNIHHGANISMAMDKGASNHNQPKTNDLLNEQNAYLLKNNQSLNQINSQLSMDNYRLHEENEKLKQRIQQLELVNSQQNKFHGIHNCAKEFHNPMYYTGHHCSNNHIINNYLPEKIVGIQGHEGRKNKEKRSDIYLVESPKKPHHIGSNALDSHIKNSHGPKEIDFSFQQKNSNHGHIPDNIYPSSAIFPQVSSMFNQESFQAFQHKFYYYSHKLQKDNHHMAQEIHRLQRENNKQLILINDIQKTRKKTEYKYQELETELSEMQHQLITNQNQYHLMQLLLLAVVQWCHNIQPIPVDIIKKNFKTLVHLMAHDEDLDLEYPELMFNTILNLNDVPPSFFPLLRLLNEEDYVIKLFDLGFFKKVIIKEINDDIQSRSPQEIHFTETLQPNPIKIFKPVYEGQDIEEFSINLHDNSIISSGIMEPDPIFYDSKQSLLQIIKQPSTNINQLAADDGFKSEKMDVEDKSRKISLKTEDMKPMPQEDLPIPQLNYLVAQQSVPTNEQLGIKTPLIIKKQMTYSIKEQRKLCQNSRPSSIHRLEQLLIDGVQDFNNNKK